MWTLALLAVLAVILYYRGQALQTAGFRSAGRLSDELGIRSLDELEEIPLPRLAVSHTLPGAITTAYLNGVVLGGVIVYLLMQPVHRHKTLVPLTIAVAVAIPLALEAAPKFDAWFGRTHSRFVGRWEALPAWLRRVIAIVSLIAFGLWLIT